MRILFATTAGAGHFGPLLPFARAASRAGHEVAVAAPEAFGPAVREAGFDLRPLAGPSDADRSAMFGRIRQASFDDANVIMARDGYLGIYARAALPAMIEHVDQWRPAVIVRESLEFASLAVAERRSTAHVEVATSLQGLGRMLRAVAIEPLADLLSLAQAPRSRVEGAMKEPLLTLAPPSLEAAEDLGRAHAFRAQAAHHSIADRAGQVIFATLGSEAAAQGFFPDLYRALIGMLAATGAEVIVALGRSADPAALEPLPRNVRVEGWVDQADVLSRATATVFHGGFGTMLDSLVAGVPMVSIPLFAIDQRIHARRLEEVGAGLAIDGPQDLGSLPDAIQRVLSVATFRDRAREFAAEMAALPSPDEAIGRLESLIESGQRPTVDRT
jgi:UDP-glucoronosyl and UDP-glucosyl transferase